MSLAHKMPSLRPLLSGPCLYEDIRQLEDLAKQDYFFPSEKAFQLGGSALEMDLFIPANYVQFCRD